MTRVATIVVKPVFIILLSVFMVISAGVSGWALTTAWNAKGHEITVARTEARHAVQQAHLAEVDGQQNGAAQKEATRLLVCKLVQINSSLTPPPTTARGVSIAAAWHQIGELPVLHCGK